MKHSSLLGQFVSYEENKVLWIRPQNCNDIFCKIILSLNWFILKLLLFSHKIRLVGSTNRTLTFSITTFSIMPHSIKGLCVTLTVNDIEHNLPSESLCSAYAECIFDELLCWVSFCWMSLCWMPWRPINFL